MSGSVVENMPSMLDILGSISSVRNQHEYNYFCKIRHLTQHISNIGKI